MGTLNPLEAQLRDTVAKTMHADPGVIEDAIMTALAHKGRAVRVAVGDRDHVLLRRHWRVVRHHGRLRLAKKWTVQMHVHPDG